MFKVNNKDTRRTPIVNFEYISHLVLVSVIKFEQVNAGWDIESQMQTPELRFRFLNRQFELTALFKQRGKIYMFQVNNANTRKRCEICSIITSTFDSMK